MKIFVRKNKKQARITWLKYVVIAYLVASWGANGVLNPLHYFKNAVMQEITFECTKNENSIVLARRQDAGTGENSQTEDAIKSGFLSFKVLSVKNNPCSLRLMVQTKEGKTREIKLKAWKGWNCVPLEQLYAKDGIWESLFVPNSIVESEQLRLGQVCMTSCRKVDTGKTIYLFVSFLFLAALWEGVWWIRKHYAE